MILRISWGARGLRIFRGGYALAGDAYPGAVDYRMATNREARLPSVRISWGAFRTLDASAHVSAHTLATHKVGQIRPSVSAD